MAPSDPIHLSTSRLIVRSMKDEDLDAVFDLHQDADVQRFTPSAPWQDRASAQAWRERGRLLNADNLARQCVVVRQEDDKVIGTCVLFRLDQPSRSGEIGYTLGRDYRGHGYITEALAALIELAFSTTVINRIEACLSPDNAASAAVLERLGFQREGLLRDKAFFNGKIESSLYYGLLRSDWRKE